MPDRNEIFHDPRRFAAEMQALFVDGWIFVGTTDQLPGPDTWFVYEAWERSLVVARDRDGALGAFVNSCSHRGTRLCPPGAQGSGRIQCPYHGWVYSCSGALLGASRRAGLPVFDNARYDLARLAVDTVGKFVFVHGCAAPERSLREFLGPQAAVLELVSDWAATHLFTVRMPLEGNWKLVVSGAIEDYHVPFVHKRTLNSKRQQPAQPVLSAHGHSSYATPMGIGPRARRVARWIYGGREPPPDFENHLVFPNLLLVRALGNVHITTFVPTGPGSTLRVSALYDIAPRREWWNPMALVRRALRPLTRVGVTSVFREDRAILAEAHAGTLAGRALERGPAHAEESRVEHFLAEAAARVQPSESR